MNRTRSRLLLAAAVMVAGCTASHSTASPSSSSPALSAPAATGTTVTTTSTTTVPPTTTTLTGSTTTLAAHDRFVFPDTTLGQAQEAQVGVDEGHQPWRLDAASVASAYGASLGWSNTTVTPAAADVYDITSAEDPNGLRLTVSQPIRQDQTGIWEIVTSTPN